MTSPLESRVALVTGAGRGIGRSIALELAAAGARVCLAARSELELEAVAAEIEASGGDATAIPADLASEGDIDALFARIASDLGPLDILVNNAGIGAFGPLEELSTSEFDRVVAVNLRGTFLCCRHALETMRPRTSGEIINIGSVVSFRGYPEQGAYVATKHGVHGLTKTLAVEARRHGIRVSTVLPGGVDTELIGRARPDLDRSTLLAPEDVARTVLFLLTLPARAAIDEIYIRRSASQPF